MLAGKATNTAWIHNISYGLRLISCKSYKTTRKVGSKYIALAGDESLLAINLKPFKVHY